MESIAHRIDANKPNGDEFYFWYSVKNITNVLHAKIRPEDIARVWKADDTHWHVRYAHDYELDDSEIGLLESSQVLPSLMRKIMILSMLDVGAVVENVGRRVSDRHFWIYLDNSDRQT